MASDVSDEKRIWHIGTCMENCFQRGVAFPAVIASSELKRDNVYGDMLVLGVQRSLDSGKHNIAYHLSDDEQPANPSEGLPFVIQELYKDFGVELHEQLRGRQVLGLYAVISGRDVLKGIARV